MRLCNEYGSAYKTVTDPASIAHLLAAGWHEVVEAPPPEETEPVVEAPKVRCSYGDPLKYKDLYLSWYVQCGSVKQLREVLTHLGVSFERRAVKKDLQALLKDHIKKTKAAMKGVEDIDGE